MAPADVGSRGERARAAQAVVASAACAFSTYLVFVQLALLRVRKQA